MPQTQNQDQSFAFAAGSFWPQSRVPETWSRGKNSRLGSSSLKTPSHRGFAVCNSTTALGLRAGWVENRIGAYRCARYYDPTIGRFISEDPIGFLGGANFYAYVENNPVDRIDPLGLSDVLITVNRTTNTGQSTMGTLTVTVNGGDPQFQGYSLEPSGTSGPQLLPVGTYGASVYDSPRLGMNVLLLNNTSPMTGVEIHPGNYPSDTHGCILPGTSQSNNFVGNSRAAFNTLMGIVNATQASDSASGQTTTITVKVR